MPIYTTTFTEKDPLGNNLKYCGLDIYAESYEEALRVLQVLGLTNHEIDGIRQLPKGYRDTEQNPQPNAT